MAAESSRGLQKGVRWMSGIKGCQAEGASWHGAIDGDCVEFLISTLAMGLCEVVATAGDETRKWRAG